MWHFYAISLLKSDTLCSRKILFILFLFIWRTKTLLRIIFLLTFTSRSGKLNFRKLWYQRSQNLILAKHWVPFCNLMFHYADFSSPKQKIMRRNNVNVVFFWNRVGETLWVHWKFLKDFLRKQKRLHQTLRKLLTEKKPFLILLHKIENDDIKNISVN